MIKELQEFLEGINHKREANWEQLYANYYSPLCCYAMKILKDAEKAADVVQSVIVKLWEADVHFEDMPSFHGYLYRSIYHNSLQVLRKQCTEELYLAARAKEEDYGQPENFAAVIEEEVVRKLRNLIDKMPEKRKEVMLLCLEEKKVEEISEILGISVNTVKKHKKEAYQYIRENFKSDILILYFLFNSLSVGS